jgi:prepilin-type N-terminal cleavage/methylation domain-containing protein
MGRLQLSPLAATGQRSTGRRVIKESRMRRVRGFTLVELLVVIGVICVTI